MQVNGAPNAGLTIAQVAQGGGVGIDTIRYYERSGLLPEPPRTTGAHRRYPVTVIERLHFIRGVKRLGLRLTEIRDLLAVRDTGACPCEPAEELLRRHLDEVDTEIGRLTALRTELTAILGQVSAGPCVPDPLPGTWCPPRQPSIAEGGGTS